MVRGPFGALGGGHHEKAQDGVRVCGVTGVEQDLLRHKLNAYCVPSIAWGPRHAILIGRHWDTMHPKVLVLGL